MLKNKVFRQDLWVKMTYPFTVIACLPLISTDADRSVVEILESYVVRFGIEEMFKDLKDVWGWGKQ